MGIKSAFVSLVTPTITNPRPASYGQSPPPGEYLQFYADIGIIENEMFEGDKRDQAIQNDNQELVDDSVLATYQTADTSHSHDDLYEDVNDYIGEYESSTSELENTTDSETGDSSVAPGLTQRQIDIVRANRVEGRSTEVLQQRRREHDIREKKLKHQRKQAKKARYLQRQAAIEQERPTMATEGSSRTLESMNTVPGTPQKQKRSRRREGRKPEEGRRLDESQSPKVYPKRRRETDPAIGQLEVNKQELIQERKAEKKRIRQERLERKERLKQERRERIRREREEREEREEQERIERERLERERLELEERERQEREQSEREEREREEREEREREEQERANRLQRNGVRSGRSRSRPRPRREQRRREPVADGQEPEARHRARRRARNRPEARTEARTEAPIGAGPSRTEPSSNPNARFRRGFNSDHEELPAYRESFHKYLDVMSFDSRFSPVLRFNKSLIKNTVELNKLINRFKEFNVFPESIDPFSLNLIDERHFDDLIPELISDASNDSSPTPISSARTSDRTLDDRRSSRLFNNLILHDVNNYDNDTWTASNDDIQLALQLSLMDQRQRNSIVNSHSQLSLASNLRTSETRSESSTPSVSSLPSMNYSPRIQLPNRA